MIVSSHVKFPLMCRHTVRVTWTGSHLTPGHFGPTPAIIDSGYSHYYGDKHYGTMVVQAILRLNVKYK